MEKDQFEACANSIRMLRVFGFCKTEKTKWGRLLQIVLQFLTIVGCGISAVVFFFSEALYLLDKSNQEKDKIVEGRTDKALVSGFFGAACVTYIYKILLLVFKKDQLQECLRSLEDCAKAFKNQSKIKEKDKLYRFFFGCGLGFATLGISFYGLAPIITMFIKSRKDPSTQKTLLVLTTYVEGIRGSPWFEIMYFYQFIGVTTIGLLSIAFDIMFCGIMSLCSGLLESASDVLKQMAPDTRLGSVSNQTEELKNIIKTYKDILKCIGRTQNLFSLSSLCHVCYNNAFIAFVLYEISVTPWSNPLRLSMIFGCGTALYQLSIYCFFGQMIPTQAEEFRKNLYNTDWYNQDKSFKQIILLTLHNTEAEPYIVAGKLIKLSHETFMDMLKASYTLYTFMTSFKE